MIALNETETRLNFVKGQGHSKLQSATLRRDDAKHRRDLLLKAIQSNTTKGRSIAEDISKLRGEISTNEQDLMAAQQMESQTKLRVETIEHEMNMERTRHEDAVVGFETKANEMDEAKVKIAQSMEEKKAMIETKKAELKKIWEKCTELRKSEGHDGEFLCVILITLRACLNTTPNHPQIATLFYFPTSLSRTQVGCRAGSFSRCGTC